MKLAVEGKRQKAKGKRQKAKDDGSIKSRRPSGARCDGEQARNVRINFAAARVSASLAIFCLLPFAFCLLSYGALPPVTPIAQETGAWLLKQARARFTGKALDEASAPRAVTMARPTTLFVTTFRRGQATRPLTGNGATLLAALKAALDSVNPNARLASSAPDRIQIDILDGELAPLMKPAEIERDA